jgi:serine protease Do
MEALDIMTWTGSYSQSQRKKKIVLGILLVSIGVVIGVVMASNLGWLSDGHARMEPIPPHVTQPLEQTGQAFVEIAKRVTPAVVNISTTKIIRQPKGNPLGPFLGDPFFRRFFGDDLSRQFEVPRERREQSLGSGVIVSEDGTIVTNNHVVAGADVIKVFLADKKEFSGKVIGADPKTDIAVVKINAEHLPTVSWGDSDKLQIGEFVLAIGNPFGLNQTVTSGIISAKGRANVGIADYEDFIQTDAAINPGNSGGALVNIRGELIGINTAIFSRSGGYMGIGFAVPSNMARIVMNSLVKEGKVTRGWLGVYIQEITPELAKQFKLKDHNGALVSDVMKGGPADRAGLERGDVITLFAGKAVEDSVHLRNIVSQTAPGRKVAITFLRRGSEKEVEVAVGELPKEAGEGKDGEYGEEGSVFEGVTVEDLTREYRDRLDIPEKVKGVVITDLEAGSAAEDAGLRVGDVLQEINRKSVPSVRDFNRITTHLKQGEAVLLLINRGGNTLFMTLSPGG